MDILSTLRVAGFFFIMGALVVGMFWYIQNLARKNSGNSKNTVPRDPNLTEVARLLRDNQTQDLVVEMNGKSFKTVHELSPGLQRRLNFSSNVLAKWLATPAPAPVTEEQTTPPTGELAWPEVPPMPAEAIKVESRPEYVPPFELEPVKEVRPVSTELPDLVGKILNPAPQPEVQFKSIAGQINDILQTQLTGTALENRGITVNDAPDHGVMVTLDGEKYPGVKDVPDEEVRAAIRAAVLEWETKK